MENKFNLNVWDTAEHLHSEEDMVLYLNACIEQDPGDGALIRLAIKNIAKAQNMTQLAKDAGITRAGLYQALSQDGNPEFLTMLKIIRALGLNLSFISLRDQKH